MFAAHLAAEGAAAAGPQFIGATTGEVAAGSSTITLTYPSGIASGDTLIAIVAANGTSGWNTESGWTRLLNAALDPSVACYTRSYSSGSSVIFDQTSGTNKTAGAMLAFRGATNVVVGTENLQSSTSTRTPGSITIPAAPADVLLVHTSDNAQAITFTNPTGFAEIAYESGECVVSVKRRQNVGTDYADTPSSTSSSSTARTVSFQIGVVG